MDIKLLIELFGYAGSVLVVVSMLMSSVVKLRIINTVGSIVSGIYAIICGAFPLALMNACLIVINIYNLLKLLKTEKVYELVDTDADDSFVKYFLNRYNDDIKKYFPGFDREKTTGRKAYVVCCDGTPAGILLGDEKNGSIDAEIDYSTPAYRDCSVGTYLYSKLCSKGIETLSFSRKESEAHTVYMRKMGFVKENDVYVKKLK